MYALRIYGFSLIITRELHSTGVDRRGEECAIGGIPPCSESGSPGIDFGRILIDLWGRSAGRDQELHHGVAMLGRNSDPLAAEAPMSGHTDSPAVGGVLDSAAWSSRQQADQEGRLHLLASELQAALVNGVFEAGLVLDGALLRCSDSSVDPMVVQKIEEAIAILDQVIVRTREVIVELDGP